MNRRDFVTQVAGCSLAAVLARDAESAPPDQEPPQVPDHTLSVVSGSPAERGRRYGERNKDAIHAFLDREIYAAFAKHTSRDAILRYAGQCIEAIEGYSPLVLEELEGMAAGSGLTLEEQVAITLHEELGKGGVLPKVEHCTALAVGPPDTRDGSTYVGQNWDWMTSVYGLSSLVLWDRPEKEGPSLLAYGYPGLWVGAGLNSAGLALCWTWGEKLGIAGPRVGIPSYVLIAQMLYQETLADALEEARRATHAGWFVFVLASGEGELANVEGTPEKLSIETCRGHLGRASYASREITRPAEAEPIALHPQCQRMCALLDAGAGGFDQGAIEELFCDHEEWVLGEQRGSICKHFGRPGGFTVDSMLFNCSTREAHLSRGPGCSKRWRTFTFESA